MSADEVLEDVPPPPLDGFVRCVNTDSGGTGDLPEAAMDHYRARGWVPVDELDQAAEAPVADPADGTVAEVEGRVGDDPELAKAALDAELAKGDKARSTLVEHLTSIVNA